MSSFTRKGTVSKASGPIHSTSYAMRGVPVRYKTPLFVPELLQLPSDWTKPSLPSMHSFMYNFTLEKRVGEQARNRAISIAAEASLQRNQITALLMQQETENKLTVEANADPPSPQMAHAFISSTDILTPTPVAPPTSNLAAREAGGPVPGSQSSLEDGASTDLMESETQMTVSDKEKRETAFKSLGNWSIREFEGGAMDPFEIASLQAINDMEELQSVLQPAAPPVVALSGSNPVPASGVVVSQSGVDALIKTPQSVVQSSPIMGTQLITSSGTYNNNVISSSLASNSSPELGGARIHVQPQIHPGNNTSESGVARSGSSPLSSSGLTAQINNPQVPRVSQNPFLSGGNHATNAPTFVSTNPFNSTDENCHDTALYPPIFSTAPITTAAQQHGGGGGGGVGTLVDLGAAPSQPPLVVSDPTRLQPGGVPSQPGGVPSPPIPRPRRRRSPSPVNSSPRGAGRGSGTVNQAGMNVSASHPSSAPVAPTGVHLGNSSPTAAPRQRSNDCPQYPGAQSRLLSVGVPVLPPITPSISTSSQASNLNEHPPAYKLEATPPTSHRISPPPPYSSPVGNSHQRQSSTAPKPAYRLSDPEKSLTLEQRAKAKTIASMGFPLPRVRRAVLRFEDDQTRIVDFLCMVGELEDAKFKGDSAETALLACKDDPEKAREYLNKLGVYKDIGFAEKDIHQAYPEAKGDWDQVLDILTRDR